MAGLVIYSLPFLVSYLPWRLVTGCFPCPEWLGIVDGFLVFDVLVETWFVSFVVVHGGFHSFEGVICMTNLVPGVLAKGVIRRELAVRYCKESAIVLIVPRKRLIEDRRRVWSCRSEKG